jgi:hypothetical protein
VLGVSHSPRFHTIAQGAEPILLAYYGQTLCLLEKKIGQISPSIEVNKIVCDIDLCVPHLCRRTRKHIFIPMKSSYAI